MRWKIWRKKTNETLHLNSKRKIFLCSVSLFSHIFMLFSLWSSWIILQFWTGNRVYFCLNIEETIDFLILSELTSINRFKKNNLLRYWLLIYITENVYFQMISVWMLLYLVRLRTAWKSFCLFGQLRGYLNIIPIGLYHQINYIWAAARGYSTTPPTKSENHWQTANDWSPKKRFNGNWWLPLSIETQK